MLEFSKYLQLTDYICEYYAPTSDGHIYNRNQNVRTTLKI